MNTTKNEKSAGSTSKVIVRADKTSGLVVVPSQNNPSFGYIRVTQVRRIIDENFFARKVELSALIPGEVEDLKAFNWQADQEVEGKIIFIEQTTPFNKKDAEKAKKDLKVAGDTEIVCMQNDKPIYRKNFYTQNESAIDVTCPHTNGEEIKAAFAKLKEAEAKL